MKVTFAAAAAIFSATALLAADITGNWEAAVETSAGSGSPSFVFQQAGDKLTGDYSGALGNAKLTGTVKGDAVEFVFKADAGGETIAVEYKGTLDSSGRKMKGTVKLGTLADGTFTATKKP
jgi:hypothetical protein